MENYILKLISGTTYKLYEGTTLVSDVDLRTIFVDNAGSAYFTFDFDGGTPTSTTELTITNSADNPAMENTNLTGIAENKSFKGTWSVGATTFDTFEKLAGKALDESQLSFLMGKIKDAGNIKPFYLTQTNNSPANLEDGFYEVLFPDSVTSQTIRYIVSTSSSSPKVAFRSNLGYRLFMLKLGHSLLFMGEWDGATNLAGGHSVGSNSFRYYAALYIPSYSSTQNGYEILSPIDGLNSNNKYSPLSAYQGKVLNTNIGDLTTLTTTAKTSAVAAINEANAKVLTNAGAPTTATVGTVGQLLVDTTNGKLYICTDATDPYVWEEVGAGGGGTIPTKTSDLTNDGADGTSTYVEADELAAVATSGSYTDLSNTPTVPTITMTTTDPGEGSALAANTFIGVYQ